MPCCSRLLRPALGPADQVDTQQDGEQTGWQIAHAALQLSLGKQSRTVVGPGRTDPLVEPQPGLERQLAAFDLTQHVPYRVETQTAILQAADQLESLEVGSRVHSDPTLPSR